ncbi:hypothetical protein [Streptomyces avermitilis]|uniref:hypothetical protein n=1 Tax=Streptomyces avermitilis TaxID=33903 RepID=UPI003806AF89
MAGEMRAALSLLKASTETLRDREHNGQETLSAAVQRYPDASVTAGQLASVVGKAYSAVGHFAYKEASSEQEPAPRG